MVAGVGDQRLCLGEFQPQCLAKELADAAFDLLGFVSGAAEIRAGVQERRGLAPLRPPRTGRNVRLCLIRLLHSNLRPHALPAQDEQVGIAAGDAPQPVHRRTFPAPEPRVLPLLPFPESLIHVTEHLNAPRAIEPPVVVQPAPHHRVHKASQILQALVVPGGRHPPAADGLPDRRRGLGADRRQEADEVSPPPVLRPSGWKL